MHYEVLCMIIYSVAHLSVIDMIIYINNRDFTVQFNNTATFSTNYGGIFIQKVNESLKVSTPDGKLFVFQELLDLVLGN